MRYFKLNTLGNNMDRSLACIDQPPEGLGIWDFCMGRGEPIGTHYPTGRPRTRLKDYPGFRVTSLIGNILTYLMVDATMKKGIEESNAGDIEYLPFELLDHKGGVIPGDFWIINPLGSFDVLDVNASVVRRGDRTGEIVGIDAFAFKGSALDGVPDIFRIPQELSFYFVSERIAARWQADGCKNVYLEEVTVV